MRPLKIIAFVLGGLVAALVIALLAVWLWVDPNDYKDRITRAVHDATGREMTLAGPLKLSVFPWLALETGSAQLGNPAGFGDQPFASLGRAAVRVRLLPLLRGRLEAGRIEVDGLDLRLRTNADGHGNWEGLFKSTATADDKAGSAGTLPAIELAGLALRDARISYQDIAVEHLDLELGRVAPGATIPVKWKASIRGTGVPPVDLEGRVDATPDFAGGAHRFSGLAMNGTLQQAAGAQGAARSATAWSLAAPELALDAGAQRLSVKALTAQLGGASVQASLEGQQVIDAPALAGSFKLAPMAPRDLFAALGITAPATRDPKVLARLAAEGQYAWSKGTLRLPSLQLQLDDTTVRGKASLTPADSMAADVDLAVDRIDLDRYLPPDAAPSTAKATDKAAAKSPPTPIPVDMLRGLHLDAKLSVGELRLAGLKASQVGAKLAGRGGLVQAGPLEAAFYGGRYAGSLTLDVRGPVPLLTTQQDLGKLDLGAFLADFAKTKRLSGRGTLGATLQARGADSDAMMRSLAGKARLSVADGAVEGIDLWFEVDRASTLIQKRELAPGQGSGRTPFDALGASVDINGGVATTRDLAIDSRQLRTRGEGSINLVSEALDMHLVATVLKAPPGSAAAPAPELAQVALDVTGTMSSPVVRPDLEGMAKARALQELDKHKDEIRDKLKGALEGLFKR
jgi:AsmA protein